MNIKVILTLVLNLCPLIAFGSDKNDYKRSIEQWGESPLAIKLYEKMQTDNLTVDDVTDVLTQGMFGTGKTNASGLKKVSKGDTTVDFEHIASFQAKDYYITYRSRTLVACEEIPSEAILKLLKTEKLDKTYKTYTYELRFPGNVFQFTLSRQKIYTLDEKRKADLLHGKKLRIAVNSQRPPSIDMGDSSSKLAEDIEAYIVKHKPESSSLSSVKLPLGTRVSEHTKKRSFSDVPQFLPKSSSSCDSSSSSGAPSPNSSPLSRKTSFAVVDTSSMYGQEETKRKKRINPSPLIKASSVAGFDFKILAKAAKKAQKKREEEKKPKDKKKKSEES